MTASSGPFAGGVVIDRDVGAEGPSVDDTGAAVGVGSPDDVVSAGIQAVANVTAPMRNSPSRTFTLVTVRLDDVPVPSTRRETSHECSRSRTRECNPRWRR